MNWVVLVAVGWAVLLVAAGLLLGRAMRRADHRSAPGRHRAAVKPKAHNPLTPEPPAPWPSGQEQERTPTDEGEAIRSTDARRTPH